MLICPQCQCQNPNHNKFCQGCGTSLTQKICAACGTKVALSASQCSHCGAETGPIWLAIVSGTQVALPQAIGASSNPAFLDLQQRYQILSVIPTADTTASEVQVRVLDRQPFQLSLLAANDNSVIALELPAIAQTYLALQSQLTTQVPVIHDAWQQAEMQVLLVADRSQWSKLTELWSDSQVSAIQIWQWLVEMTQLWAALSSWHCRQSLLELSNLRVNRAGAIGLQRLYAELPDAEPSLTLSDLGQLWQRLFQESQRTKFGSIFSLIADLQAEKIQAVEELQSRLQAIAKELQVSVAPPQPPPLSSVNQSKAAGNTEVTATLNNSAALSILPMDEPQDNLTNEDLSPTVVLPMQLVSLDDAGTTDVGRQRHHNEDCFGIETAVNKVEFPQSLTLQARGLYVLCDGMGGHAGGEVASRLAVKTLQQYFQMNWPAQMSLPAEDTIREAVRLANQAIFDLNQQDARSGVGRMGTTLVLVLLQNNQVAVAHVGDSRLYRFSRQRGLEQVTLDHEVGQREILRGVEPEIAYARPDAYQLTQALGPRDENYVNPDIQFIELNEDTLLLLASDGLTDYDLIEHHWQTHLEPLLSSGASLRQGVNKLIELANQHNGHDNITAVVVRAKVRPQMEKSKG